MVREDLKKVEEELKKLDDTVYGEDQPGGTESETSDIQDAAERLEKFTGDDEEGPHEVDSALDIEEDEDSLVRGGPNEEDDTEEEEDDHLEIDDDVEVDSFGNAVRVHKNSAQDDDSTDEDLDQEEE